MSKIIISLKKLEKLLIKLGEEKHSGEVNVKFSFRGGGVRNVRVSTTKELEKID